MAYVFRPSILAFAGHFAIGFFAAFVYLAFCSMTRSTEGRRQSTGYYANEMVDIKAARHFEKALDSRPNEPATLNNLAIAYVKQGKKERALECAEAAARILPNSPEIRHTLEELRK